MSTGFVRRCAILIVDVDLDASLPWDPGPLPFGDGQTAATEEVRRSYFNERAGQALYGANRSHRWADSGREQPAVHDGLEVLGLELIRIHEHAGSGNALLAVHANVRGDGLELVETLAALADLGPAGSPSRGWYDGLLEGCGSVRPSTRRATTVTLAMPGPEPLDPLLASSDYDGWTPELQWLWLLASATPFRVYRPPPEYADALLGSYVRLSAGWHALVLRDGAAFLGSGEDMGHIYRLFPDPELHFRSIYLDALLLGHMQRLRLGRIADVLATLTDPVAHPDRLFELEQEMTAFRNVFWWQQLGPHWHGNQLLRAYQRQHEIPELFAQVIDELEDYSRKAQTAATQRTEALLGVVTVVGLPFGLAVGILHALGNESWVWLLVSLAAAAAFSGAILATETGRTLLRLWRLLGPGARRRSSRGE